MKKLFSLFTIALLSAALFSSCSKKGCVDQNANNYCDKCKKDDGSCTYTGKMIIWWKKQVADSLNAYGVNTIYVYADGALVGGYATNVYYNSQPNCDQSGTITITKDLGKNKTKIISVEMKDASGNSFGVESKTLTGNQCLSDEVTW